MVSTMSDFVRKKINGNEYVFINSFRGNRSGFVHETELYKNDYNIGWNKVQYYNRTWESYTYQSVMKGLVSALMESHLDEYKNAWKEEHGIKRLTESKRKIMQEELQKNPPAEYLELKELYAML